jgi:hypothetical protein
MILCNFADGNTHTINNYTLNMKRTLFIILLAAMAVGASAQTRWGVEAGANISHAHATNKTKAGFNVGATVNAPFARHWALDAALKLSSQPCGNDVWKGTTAKVNINCDYTPYYLILPIRAEYSMALAPSIRMMLAAGPMAGVGLFGNGSWNYAMHGIANITMESRSNDIFRSDALECFSSSRFEYGGNAKLGFEFFSHYTFGLEYSLLHIPGDVAATANMSILSLNLGYRF